MHLFMGIDAKEIARSLFVSERSVYRFSKRFEVTGDVRPALKRNGPIRELSEFDELTLVHLVLTNPGIYLRELQDLLLQSTGHLVSVSTVCRSLKRIGLTRQKITHVALQQSEIKRTSFTAEMAAIDPSMILWIDETGCDRRNSLRKYGYSIRGHPPQDYCLNFRGERYSAIGIMSMEGVNDVYITKGTVDGVVFMEFVETQLLPILNPFNGLSPHSVVVMDNASIHHIDEVFAAISATGALLRFLPPYSPDMNPIELLFAEVKQYLQANSALLDTTLTIPAILLITFNSITEENCIQYIKHSGY